MAKFFLFLALLFCSTAHAACSGSGTTWTCTAGSTSANVNSALSSGSDGMTITLDAGSYTWTASLSTSISKGFTLICASEGACTMTMNGPLWQWANWGSTSKLYRISGFVFNAVDPYFIWLYGTGSSTATMTQLRFDHNEVNVASSASDIITFGEVTGVNTTIFGVIDHNTFATASGNSRWIVMYDQAGAGTWPTGRFGSANNLFIEDNAFTDQCMNNAGNAALDTDGGPHSWVVRYNAFTNTRIEHHGYYWSFPGPSSSEVYNNTFNHTCGQTDGSYSFKHQGSGEWIVFNNTVTASSKGSPHILQNYRSFYDFENACDGTDAEDGNRTPTGTYHGYPCNRQPGRNSAGTLRPQYYWNNQWWDATSISISISCADQGTMPVYCADHLQANRDYYQGGIVAQTSATSPFNGTTGTGFGLLSRRPTTCTTGPESADAGNGGVGYFATDNNTLYRCSATDTWSVHYTPYTYPHPLVGAAAGPSAPANFRLVLEH